MPIRHVGVVGCGLLGSGIAQVAARSGHEVIVREVSREFREPRLAAPPLLRRMVFTGWIGRKAGRGFYDYTDPKHPRSRPPGQGGHG